MASDESGCELPDLEEDDDYGNSSQPPTLPPQGRRDFYSDSSDVEVVEPIPEYLTVAGKTEELSGTHSGCSELPELASAADVALIERMEDDGGRLSYDLANDDVITVPIETSRPTSLTATSSNTLYLPSKPKKAAKGSANLLEKEDKKLEKEKQKLLKSQLKQQTEFEKSKKRLLQEITRSMRPGECLKHLTVMIDTCLLSSSCGPAIVKCLQTANVRYEVDKQPETNMMSFWRGITVATEIESNKLETQSKEVIEDEILIYVPLNQFLEMISNFHEVRRGVVAFDDNTLINFIQKVKSRLKNHDVTLFVQGIENYFRLSNLKDKTAFRSRVMEMSGDVSKRKRKCPVTPDNLVTRIMIDEAVLACQLQCNVCIKFLETDEEVAKTILHYAKAVAEKPYKKELSNRLNSGYSGIFVEGCRGGTRIGSDGQGLARVWCQQLQQFKSVSTEVANAIAARYPSPRTLIEAYQTCKSEKEAENLLEDIVVRRGAGIVSTARRVGKEMSRRLYILMTSDDGNQVIK